MGASELRLREIRSLDEMAAYRDKWNSLSYDMSDATPFQTWEWNYGIAKFNNAKVRLRIVVAEDANGDPIGIAPFWIRKMLVPPMNVLQFIGTRTSDYLDFICRKNHREAFVKKISAWIEKNLEWDTVDLQSLREASARLLKECGSFDELPFDVCTYASLPESKEEFEKALPKKQRKNIQRRLRKLERETNYKCAVYSTPEEVRENLSYLYDLHQRRQEARGERGRFFKDEWRRCFKSMSVDLAQSCYVRLIILWIDGNPAASSYNLRKGDREYGYIIGMDPDFARYSPGSLLIYFIISEAIKDGTKVLDFLRGSEEYKGLWTNERVELVTLTASRSMVYSWAFKGYNYTKDRIYRNHSIKKAYFTAMKLSRLFRGEASASVKHRPSAALR